MSVSDNAFGALIEGRKYARQDLGHVLVLGLGVSGKAAVEYLLPLVGNRVRTLSVMGGKSTDANTEWAATHNLEDMEGVTLVWNIEDAACALPEGVQRFDVCIASPGIPMFSDFYQSALGSSNAVISEVEFAWCESAEDAKWVAITGTNGKTTTTSLTEHLLAGCGFPAKAVGNIGDACITAVAHDLQSDEQAPYYVVECSSYQLASINRFAPDVAVLLGITPDHIKWHKTHEHYASSKLKVFSNLAKADDAVAILDATNDEVREYVKKLRAMSDEERGFKYIPIGTKNGVRFDMRQACGSENAAFINENGMLDVAFGGTDHVLANALDLQILGEHNQINSLAAAAAAVACGASDAQISEELCTFEPLEHRIEPSGTVAGVSFYNDSKATNVDATLQALKAFLPKKPIVMFGGDDKGTDLTELRESCAANVKAIVCYGEGGPRFFEAMSPLSQEGIEVVLIDTFDNAFAKAYGMADEGDIVLLSPACASFDEFSCFEERGEHFKELVASLGSNK